jgi:hypothetical protein
VCTQTRTSQEHDLRTQGTDARHALRRSRSRGVWSAKVSFPKRATGRLLSYLKPSQPIEMPLHGGLTEPRWQHAPEPQNPLGQSPVDS